MELRKHIFKYAKPEFAESVKPGDVVIGGKSFGCGSSREHAAIVFKACNVYLVADSYGWIFKRNCINTGVLPLEKAEAIDITDGDSVEVDLEKYVLSDITKKKNYKLKALPKFVLSISKAGGLIEYLNAHRSYLNL
jgi:3-isopropylmalate/(R)-2-methylmalate dehydratase small subunit